MTQPMSKSSTPTTDRPILVTGATGYVGGRLTPKLLEAGYRVRAAVRTPSKLNCRAWAGHPNLEIVAADMLDRESMIRAAEGCSAAYYLVHSMTAKGRDFARADREAARNFVEATGRGGVERIIYLGGLGDYSSDLSEHLRSRLEVGRILQSGPVPTTFLRAAIILGSGSASFEILRYLAERLPVMVSPVWVDTKVQPICIRNVLNYLIGCLERPETIGQTYDIGGPEVVTYRQLFQCYGEAAGLPRRLIVTIPFFSPTLSAYWIGLVTPVPAEIAKPLAEGLRNTVVVTDDRLAKLIPQHLMTCRETITRAREKEAAGLVDTRWSDHGDRRPPEWIVVGDAPYSGGTVFRVGYRVRLDVPPQAAWAVITRLGGHTGWYAGEWLWRLRGLLDDLIGGVGLRRGRRHPEKIWVGDAIDFWRVLDVEPPWRLLLLAEMKLPGEAVLEFKISPAGSGGSQVEMISRFRPKGLFGLIYWYSLLPVHGYLFGGMLREIAQRAGSGPVARPVKFIPSLATECVLE